MTDELITDLAQIRALRISSRTSVMPYKQARKHLAQIAKELDVGAVVEGTVLRSGDNIRITAQLIQVPNERDLWAKSYEGDERNVLLLQDQVARDIATEIRIQLTPQDQARLRNPRPVDAQAYEAYLKGRYYWDKMSTAGFHAQLRPRVCRAVGQLSGTQHLGCAPCGGSHSEIQSGSGKSALA